MRDALIPHALHTLLPSESVRHCEVAVVAHDAHVRAAAKDTCSIVVETKRPRVPRRREGGDDGDGGGVVWKGAREGVERDDGMEGDEVFEREESLGKDEGV